MCVSGSVDRNNSVPRYGGHFIIAGIGTADKTGSDSDIDI